MRRVSPKRAKLNRERRKVVEAIVAERGEVCERCRMRRATDPHEVLSRARGGSIVDPANIKILCRECHDLVTLGMDDAFLTHSWERRGYEDSQDSYSDEAPVSPVRRGAGPVLRAVPELPRRAARPDGP